MPVLQKFGSALRDLGRLQEILRIFAVHGFGFLIDRLQLQNYLPSRERVCRMDPKTAAPVRLRLMLSALGPVFIKFGQMLSQRPDMLPAGYLGELSKLQDQVPPFAFPEVKKLLEEELGGPLEKLFLRFDPQPLAAASMGQVHRAVTRNHRVVAVKIQRPGLEKILHSDLEILRLLARLWENLGGEDFPRHPVDFVDEFDRLMRAELDFRREGRHMERFQANFQPRPGFRFPRVEWGLSSTRILTLEYISGFKLTELPDSVTISQRKKLAQRLIDGYIHMALEDRFFHADPHPGNFLLDAGGRIAFLDVGQVGRLDRETVLGFTDMLMALVERDTDAVVEAYLRLGSMSEDGSRRQLKRDVEIFLEQYYDLNLDQISFGRSLEELVGIAVKYRIELPPDFIALAKTFLGAESLARSLDPSLNLVAAAQPVARKLLRRRFDPKHVTETLWKQGRSLGRFFTGLPEQLHELLHKLQRGRLKMEFEHKGLEEIQHSLDRASNRLSFSLIVASLIVGSSLLLVSRVGPHWRDFSILGLVGYSAAGLLGLWLLLAILRSGRL